IRDFHVTGVQTCALPIFVLGLIYAAAAVVLLIFAWPWLPRPEAGGESLARYVPMRDGDSWLSARHNAEGEVVAWISGNQVKLQEIGRASCRESGERAAGD